MTTKRPRSPAKVLSLSDGSTIREADVTPDMARQWLSPEKSAPNRSLSEGTISTYSYSLREGRWGLYTVIFDRKGKMLDGQHHLEAIARTGITARMTLRENCSEASLTFIDMGRPRSTADAMRIATGDLFTRQKVAMARAAVAMGAQTDNRSSLDLIEKYLADLGKEHVSAICEHRIRLSRAWLFALVYVRPIDPALIDDVLRRLATNDAVFNEGPFYKARTATMSSMLRMRDRPEIKASSNRLAHIVFRGLQALKEGEELAFLTTDSSGFAWVNAQRTERGLLTVIEMLPATYPKPKTSRPTRDMIERRATSRRTRSTTPSLSSPNAP